jgi:hypothetical protein
MSNKNMKKKSSKKKCITSLIIGDPHFKHTNLDVMEEFSNKTIEIAERLKPTFIVILGDTLDTHEIIRIEPRDAAEAWIEKLTEISEVYLLIGNHDMANPNEFLTKKHAFNSMKRWSSVEKGRLHIVDEPTYKEIHDKTFVMCPYVPPGRFKEALDELYKKEFTWDLADCIFAHQQFKGGHQGAYEITDGDEWDEDYPHVINGHFHNEELINKNIHIVGTPIQHSYGDSPDKKIWFLKFDDEDEDLPFSIEKLSLGIKTKKMHSIDIEDVHNFKLDLLKKYDIKLKIQGEPEQIQIFKTTETYKKLSNTKGLKLSFEKKTKDNEDIISAVEVQGPCREEVSYLGVLQKIVEKKPDSVKEMYKEIVGSVEVVYDVVFEESEEEEDIEEESEELENEDIEESEEDEDIEEESEEEELQESEEEENIEENYDESEDIEIENYSDESENSE